MHANNQQRRPVPLTQALKPLSLHLKTQTCLVKHALKSSISMKAMIKESEIKTECDCSQNVRFTTRREFKDPTGYRHAVSVTHNNAVICFFYSSPCC